MPSLFQSPFKILFYVKYRVIQQQNLFISSLAIINESGYFLREILSNYSKRADLIIGAVCAGHIGRGGLKVMFTDTCGNFPYLLLQFLKIFLFYFYAANDTGLQEI
jgi:hypothetical protein